MRNWQATPSAGPAPPAGQDLLFTPGPRLGWVFRDRRELAAPYPEPEPSPQAVHAQAVASMATAEQAWQRTWKWIGKPSIGLALLLGLLAGCARSVSGQFSLGLTAVTFVVLCGPGFAWTGWQWLRREQSRDMTPEQEYRQAMADWDQRATDHENAELARLAGQPEWGSATIPRGGPTSSAERSPTSSPPGTGNRSEPAWSVWTRCWRKWPPTRAMAGQPSPSATPASPWTAGREPRQARY